MQTFVRCEGKKKPNPLLLFTDVYARVPPRLKRQMNSTSERLTRHVEHYGLDQFESVQQPVDQ